MRVRGRVAAGVCTVTLAAGALSACSGASSEAAKPEHSSSAPTSPSASSAASSAASAAASASAGPSTSPRPTADRSPRTPPPRKGKAGQKLFARHVMDVWAYALRTDRAEALTRMSPRKQQCEGCAAFARELRKRKKQGWVVQLSGVRVRAMRTTRLDKAISVVRSTVDVPTSRSVNKDGSFRSSNQGHRAVTFEVAMRYTRKRYQLLSFTVG